MDLPEGATPVKCKWVFKRKSDTENKMCFRGRQIARGFTQKESVHYSETFSPVVKHATLRLLIALSVNLDLDITHSDITTAFLHGTLDETVYMEQPEAFIEIDKESKVLKLNKAIYGLKQSSRVWYERVESFLIGLGFVKS